jgi:amidohydrolase
MPNISITEIKNLAAKNFDLVKSIRRHIHAHPELSFVEYNTQAYIIEKLNEIGITNIEKKANTGVVAIINGQENGKSLALRADMDALPITEGNEVTYRSTNAGVMHACGHDVHTASLLGCASILQTTSKNWSGTVKLIFQPGEEKLPGGASLMIEDGALKNPAPNKIIGQHVMPQLSVGKVGFRKGLYMASTDEIYVTVNGKGGHGAMPHLCIDPVMISAQILVALQQIVSRFAKPTLPSVLSFGKIIANGATNVIPNEVFLEGTFRTLDEKWRAEAHQRMKSVAESIASSMGGSCNFEIKKGYPFLINDPELTEELIQAATDYLGKENVEELEIWMAAEDFAFYSQIMPASFYRLGVRNEEKGIVSPVHTTTFDIDEDALKIGMGLMAWLTISQLA